MGKTIVNPETGRKVKINAKIGKKILNSYKNQFQLGGDDKTWFWQQQIQVMLNRTLEKITAMIRRRWFREQPGKTDELKTYFESIQNALRDSKKKEIIKKLIYTITQSHPLRLKLKLFTFPYRIPLELKHIKEMLDDKEGDDLDVLLFVLECWTHLNDVVDLPENSQLFGRHLENDQKPIIPEYLRNDQYTTELIKQVEEVFNNLRDYRLNKNYTTHGNRCVVGEIPINGTFDKSCCMITEINGVPIEDIDDETFNKLNKDTKDTASAFNVLEGQTGELAYDYYKNTFDHGKMFSKTFTSNKHDYTHGHIMNLKHNPTHNACIPHGLQEKRDEKKTRHQESQKPRGMRRRMSFRKGALKDAPKDAPRGMRRRMSFRKDALNVDSNIGRKVGSNIGRKVGSNIVKKVGSNIGRKVGSNIDRKVGSNIGRKVGSNIGSLNRRLAGRASEWNQDRSERASARASARARRLN